MVTRIWYIFMASLLHLYFPQVEAQERSTVIVLDLKKNQTDSFKIQLMKGDFLKLTLRSNRNINFGLIDPAGQPIKTQVLGRDSLRYNIAIDSSGSYTIKLNNTSRFLKVNPYIRLSLNRSDTLPSDTCINYRIQRPGKVLINDFQVSRKKQEEFKYFLKTGDRLNIRLEAKTKNFSEIKLTNDAGELILSVRNVKAFTTEEELPIYHTGNYTLSLKTAAYLPRNFHLELTKTTISESNRCRPPALKYDSILAVHLDTTIYLGARRDLLHASKGAIQFGPDKEVGTWGYLIGAGQSYQEGIKRFESNVTIPSSEDTVINDLLTAYALGLINDLPGPGAGFVEFEKMNKQEIRGKLPSERIRFTISKNIEPNREQPKNYGLIRPDDEPFSILFENYNHSFGMQVFIKIIKFNILKTDNEEKPGTGK